VSKKEGNFRDGDFLGTGFVYFRDFRVRRQESLSLFV